jgi:hypothetical protein
MNTLVSQLARNLSCVVAASVITLVVGMAFVQSTDVPPGTSTLAQVTSPAPLYT